MHPSLFSKSMISPLILLGLDNIFNSQCLEETNSPSLHSHCLKVALDLGVRPCGISPGMLLYWSYSNSHVVETPWVHFPSCLGTPQSSRHPEPLALKVFVFPSSTVSPKAQMKGLYCDGSADVGYPQPLSLYILTSHTSLQQTPFSFFKKRLL